MEKLTLSKAKDESVDYLIASAGAMVGITAMKMATGYGLNKWLVPFIGFAGGIAIKLVTKNPMAKSFGTGLGIAGGLDLGKKGLDFVGAKIPALANLTQNIPGFSGTPSYLNGFSGVQDVPYTEVRQNVALLK